jgi:hypothetical protein
LLQSLGLFGHHVTPQAQPWPKTGLKTSVVSSFLYSFIRLEYTLTDCPILQDHFTGVLVLFCLTATPPAPADSAPTTDTRKDAICQD